MIEDHFYWVNMRLSVIIPVYNRPEKVIRAIESIPNRDDVEVIVVDDCSTDNTLDTLTSYDKRPIIILQTNTNSGPGIARNAGLDVAKGEYVLFLDSDDWLVTENINSVLDNLDKLNKYDLIWFDNKLLGGKSWWANDCKIVMQGQLMRREFIGNLRHNSKMWGEDRDFANELKNKNPKEIKINTQIYVYDANYDSGDSIGYKYNKGIL